MKILWAEDDKRLGPMIARALREDGIDVTLVEDGNEVMELAVARLWDLILLDRRLPGLDGLEIVGWIRERDRQVPIILLTAMSDVDERVAGLSSGADDYLVKPFAYAELLARIRLLAARSIARKAGGVDEDLTVGEISLDQVRHVVRLGGHEIELTVREYAVAALLARHAGEVVPRHEIIEEVWASRDDLYDNVVDVTVSRLRRKLDEIGAGSLIETVRGTGYRMGSER